MLVLLKIPLHLEYLNIVKTLPKVLMISCLERSSHSTHLLQQRCWLGARDLVMTGTEHFIYVTPVLATAIM